MKIYKVVLVVNKYNRDKNIVRVETRESVFIDNLESAKRRFDSYVSQAKDYSLYRNRFGKVALFEPKIHNDGEIGNYTDNDYISIYDF